MSHKKLKKRENVSAHKNRDIHNNNREPPNF